MAEVKDFIDTTRVKEQIKEAYEEGYHFHWICLAHTTLDQLLKAYLYTSIVGSYPTKKLKNEHIGWLKRLTFGNLLNISYITGILTDQLYEQLRKINSQRNLILHNLIMKNERLKEINLKKYYELCKNAIEKLIIEWLDYTKLQIISKETVARIIKELKENDLFKEENENK